MATIAELVALNRSCRRFDGNKKVSLEEITQLVDLARLSASAANLQPLKYMISASAEMNAKIFPCLKWAGYLKDWDGPFENERPAAYVVVLHDTSVAGGAGCDHGIAAQSLMLGAVEKGLAGCMIAAVDRKNLGALIGLPDHMKILLVIALGYPVEERKVVTLTEETGVKYFRDDKGIHYVPKRSLEEVILKAW
ncbi:nitroreductase family protein [Desulforegula conservatrix]|uniref:nitroreductase family protein n=1 Tax=Desulforegula conservatrix TaxID=153026 RepID=UPI0004092CB5|nr:nitroreductase family protein [Desulforegula conservatrix]